MDCKMPSVFMDCKIPTVFMDFKRTTVFMDFKKTTMSSKVPQCNSGLYVHVHLHNSDKLDWNPTMTCYTDEKAHNFWTEKSPIVYLSAVRPSVRPTLVTKLEIRVFTPGISYCTYEMLRGWQRTLLNLAEPDLISRSPEVTLHIGH